MRAAGEEYARVATQIQTAAATLRAIAGGFDQCSEAISEVQAKAHKVADSIERAQERYATTGNALVTYAETLARAQGIAQEALSQAQIAVQAQYDAEQDISYWSRQEADLLDGAMTSAYANRVAIARNKLTLGDESLSAARVTLGTATAMRDEGAEAAASLIKTVVSADDLHDSVWQNLGGGAQEVGLWAWNGMDELAAGLGLLAMVLCWVPGLNAALGAVALIAGALVLVRDTVNASTGNGTWGEAGFSALALVTFGVGRVASQGVRMAASSARASSVARTATVAGKTRGAATSAARAVSLPARGITSYRSTTRAASPSIGGRAGELFGVLKPSAIVADTASDLRGGARLLQSTALGPPGLHARGPASNLADPLSEGAANLTNAFKNDRSALAFKVLGQEEVARDGSYLFHNKSAGPLLRSPTVWGRVGVGLLGANQVVERSLAVDSARNSVQ
ncbi:hypothetical protein [Pengzhenrongella phosphoraccumulans]|uniref:hypothetical protein n=1 Tax=Pengzhenrongella phosphoraccumulans TaxID=3114394 RepID=UPI00388DCBC3